MDPNLATEDVTSTNVMASRQHSIAEINGDADAHVERHRQDLDAGPARVRVEMAQSGFAVKDGSDDASSCRLIRVEAFGNVGEVQSQDIAALIAATSTVPPAAGVISPRDTDDVESGDREGGDGDEAAVAHDWDVDWFEGDVQEPVEAAVESLLWHVVEEPSEGGGSSVTVGQFCMLRGSHVLDLPSTQQSQGYAHAYAGRGFWVDGVVEVLGDLHGVV
jgi:hypothetical protein